MLKIETLAVLCLLLSSVLSGPPQWTLKKSVDSLNKARTNPQYMQDFIKKEIEDITTPKTGKCQLSGKRRSMIEDCPLVFNDLRSFYSAENRKTGALELDMGISWGAYLHCKYLGTKVHKLTHADASGDTSPSKKIKPWTTKSTGSTGENIHRVQFDYMTEEFMMADFILDDGVASRGHRKNSYNPVFKKIGIGLYQANAADDKYQYMCINLASQYECDKCNEITCAMQKEMRWDQYLKDMGKPDPCAGKSEEDQKKVFGTTGVTKGLEMVKEGSTQFSFLVLGVLAFLLAF